MQYALLGDLHSHKDNTEAVLAHIAQIAPKAAIIGLGDLYECTIGKKKATSLRNLPLKEAAIYKKKFQALLTFPSIIGNQEERIALVTGRNEFLQYPETIEIEGATLIHGHQFQWDENFHPTFPKFSTPLVFFGHSHRSAIYVDEQRTTVPYNIDLYVGDKDYIINVGSVVETCDWCLYDAHLKTVTFLQAKVAT